MGGARPKYSDAINTWFLNLNRVRDKGVLKDKLLRPNCRNPTWVEDSHKA
jgi:hypothetical protein